jgi:hypothetical protein
MPKPNRGKTQTVKQRAIYVYLPSIEMVNDWKHRVQRAGTSISKFVIEHVEDSLRREDGEEGYVSRLELIKQLEQATTELKTLRRDNRLLTKLVDTQEQELKRLRAQPFLTPDFTGVRRMDQELIDLLKKGGFHTGDDILAQLNINPTETELIKAINTQIEVLENYGLVTYTSRGWQWSE